MSIIIGLCTPAPTAKQLVDKFLCPYYYYDFSVRHDTPPFYDYDRIKFFHQSIHPVTLPFQMHGARRLGPSRSGFSRGTRLQGFLGELNYGKTWRPRGFPALQERRRENEGNTEYFLLRQHRASSTVFMYATCSWWKSVALHKRRSHVLHV